MNSLKQPIGGYGRDQPSTSAQRPAAASSGHHHHPAPHAAHHHHVHSHAPVHHHHSSRPQGEYLGFGNQVYGGGYGFGGQDLQQREQAAHAQAQAAQQQALAEQQAEQQRLAAAAAQALPPRVPLADRDVYMLSLPSQDLPTYYDPSEDSDSSSSCSNPPPPLTTNRGNKLKSSSRNVRRGRLGAYPHTDTGFTSPASKRRKTLDGTLSPRAGFAVAPNLHLLRPEPSFLAPAVLPPPPQTPLDLLLSSSLQHTLGNKNAVFRTLGMSATGLIEQEGALIGNLRRVCAGLRGEGYEWRWDGDEERMRQRKQERAVEEAEELELERKREAEREEIRRQREIEDQRREDDARKERERVEEEAAEAERQRIAQEEELAAAAEAAALADAAAAEAAIANESTAADANGAVDAPAANGADDPAAEPASTTNGVTSNGVEAEVEADGDTTMSVPTGALPPLPAELPPLPSINGGDAATGATLGEELAFDPLDEPLTRRRSGRVASRAHEPRQRSSSTSSSSSESSEPLARGGPSTVQRQPGSRIPLEELPEYAKRLVDPEIYVRSLFVSKEPVQLPVQQINGPATLEFLSPNEQEVMVHDCLTDLHRFLADSLEYRSRLAEIRDGVLGVERRRKGMWRLVRATALDWLEEESHAEMQEQGGM
ncbi:hypothetical protein RQP46_002200 [Phenoliferia psychrophenolica]